ncbi:winged helix-turn-helix transcriptional regulator [Agrobacterium radiobacter]|uniref:winged helix-turn-helix transcriptional regulator n=1 Tax=Agrobacterium radiobacter TaxID=362 RepID=UPI0003603AAC|nr:MULTISPECIES: helix-turn-helix domain-containing protein [Agrobacterium tumefaciens complex]EPR23324.1 MarR family transcriptional regulator [Agrobacterium radiobacter DSM 30147]KAB0459265.1 helix-turn-helix transcriptional regulator [Agrobacterium tumefaciens]KWT75464.1 MarR family transcriptional regulator [Agrobacterium radiobacter]NIB11683.1 helix-turn-helix transcriptional regulator [Agrobacterium radiobacter]OOO33184.1 MarR family transcriptional regulator [Agrobacterium radiobacter]
MNDSTPKTRARRAATKTGCAVEATISVVGGIWKPVILFHLLDGKLRFNAICRLTPAATPRMITLQLRELEADGIISRTIYPEVPPKVEYELTELGFSLEPLLLAMCGWGERLQESHGITCDTGKCRPRSPKQVLEAGPDRWTSVTDEPPLIEAP